MQFQKLKLGTLWLFNSPIFHTPPQSPKRLINNTCPQNTCVLSKCTQHQVTQRSQETPCSLALLLMSNKEGTTTVYHPSSWPLHPALLSHTSQPLCQAPDAHGRWRSGRQVLASWHRKHLLSLPNANCHQSRQHPSAFICKVHKRRCVREGGS